MIYFLFFYLFMCMSFLLYISFLIAFNINRVFGFFSLIVYIAYLKSNLFYGFHIFSKQKQQKQNYKGTGRKKALDNLEVIIRKMKTVHLVSINSTHSLVWFLFIYHYLWNPVSSSSKQLVNQGITVPVKWRSLYIYYLKLWHTLSSFKKIRFSIMMKQDNSCFQVLIHSC